MKTNEFNNLVQDILKEQVKNVILESINGVKKEVFHIKCDGEPVDTFDTEEDAEAHLDIYKKDHPGKQFIIEKGVYESDIDMIDKLDEMGQQLEEKENQNMEKNTVKVKSIAEAILHAKENNKKTIKINNETYDVQEYWKKLEEQEGIGEVDEEMSFDHRDMKIEKMEQIAKTAPDWVSAVAKLEDYGVNSNVAQSIASKFHSSSKEDSNIPNDTKKIFDDAVSKFPNTMKKLNDKKEIKPGVDLGKSFDKFKLNLDEKEEECDECGDMKEGEQTEGFDEYVKKQEKDNKSGVCTKCGKEVCECGDLNESSKKKLRIKESQFIHLINNMVTEAMKGQPGIPGIPGVTVTKKAQSGSKKENDAYISDVEKKMKDHLSFDGNDNPEFPNQIGGNKMAVNNTEEQDETVEDNRGRTSVDINYDNEPSERFKKRAKMSLEGSIELGNPKDAANTIPSKVGEKVIKKGERVQKLKKEEPFYHKEPTPIKSISESNFKLSPLVSDEIEKIKKLTKYNKKTQ